MSIDEQPMNVYWSGKRTETSNNFKTNYKGSVATKNNLPSSSNKMGDMYNVIESGENFIWNGSSWDSLSGDTLKTLNWQKSEKASTVAIYPVPETMLYPVVEFAFTEIDPAEGDKSPDNPSTITGVSSITVTRCETVGVDSIDYTINLNGTYYGGTLDFSTGVMTVTHGFSTISSTTNVSNMVIKNDTVCFTAYLSYGHPNVNAWYDHICKELPFSSSADNVSYELESWRPWGGNDYKNAYFNIFKSRLDVSKAANPSNPTNAEWKTAINAWLASNSLHCVTTLATPYTVTFTPTEILSLAQTNKYTPRLNTVYTNASSVQVGYVKSPIRSEYELA